MKYISNGGKRTVDRKNVLRQLWNTAGVNAKAQGTIRLNVITDYMGLIVRGERKLDALSTLRSAKHRKELYSELRLFEPDNAVAR